jgi:hypothetical protein
MKSFFHKELFNPFGADIAIITFTVDRAHGYSNLALSEL